MVCLHLEDCKETKQNSKGCYNPSGWKECKVYQAKFMLEDLLDMLTNQQGFDGTKDDLQKMQDLDKLYELAEKDIGIELEVEIVNPKYAYGTSIYEANINYHNTSDKPAYEDQKFTGKWREI